MPRRLTPWLLLFVLAGCAGEVTTIEFGDAEQEARDRFRDEIYPILLIQDSGTVEGAEAFYTRDCSQSFCHGSDRPNGALPVLPGNNADNALKSFRAGIENEQIILGDAAASSFLQHTFMDGTHPSCFPSRDDCCFRKIEAWLNAVEPPECDDCPVGDPG